MTRLKAVVFYCKTDNRHARWGKWLIDSGFPDLGTLTFGLDNSLLSGAVLSTAGV